MSEALRGILLCSAWVVARCGNSMIDGVFTGKFIAKPQRCSRCGLRGHNASDCPRLGVPRCSFCSSTWHSTRNCRNRDPSYGRSGGRFKVQDRAAIVAYCRGARPTVSPGAVGEPPGDDERRPAAARPMGGGGTSAVAGGTTGSGGSGAAGGAEGGPEDGGGRRQWRGRTRTPRARTPSQPPALIPGSCQTSSQLQGPRGSQGAETTEDGLRPRREFNQDAVGWSGRGRRSSRSRRRGGWVGRRADRDMGWDGGPDG